MLRILITVLGVVSCSAGAAELNFPIGETRPGTIPAGFRGVLVGTGAPPEWKVILDEAPPLFTPFSPKAVNTSKRAVLAQLSRDPTDERFPALIYESEVFADFRLTTQFKLVDGMVEQMAGLVFRYQDERNFYYIRASGLGNSFYFFKVVDGVRSVPIGNKIEISKGVWHELSVECRGNQIRATLDGKDSLPVLSDKSFSVGKVGFWTKSDSVSYFTDARLTFTPLETLAQILVKDAMKKNPRLLGLRILALSTNNAVQIIGSSDPGEVSQPGPAEVEATVLRGVIYYGKADRTVSVTMPLHDSNGDTVAAARVRMKPFPGQTEKNAIARALPIIKEMEGRIRSRADLMQ